MKIVLEIKTPAELHEIANLLTDLVEFSEETKRAGLIKKMFAEPEEKKKSLADTFGGR